jgi:hypothetical protein
MCEVSMLVNRDRDSLARFNMPETILYQIQKDLHEPDLIADYKDRRRGRQHCLDSRYRGGPGVHRFSYERMGATVTEIEGASHVVMLLTQRKWRRLS